MNTESWLSVHWFQLVQSIGITFGLLFTGYQVLQANRSRQASHMLSITQAHRDIWKLFYDHRELARVWKESVDLAEDPITEEEKLFVTLVILHLNCVLELSARRMIVPIEGLDIDVYDFFGLPIPQKVWNHISHMQNERLIQLVESAISRRGRQAIKRPSGGTHQDDRAVS